VASPLAIYGGVPRDADGSPLRALAGLLLDRSFGLLPYAPVFLVALAGLAALVRARAWAPLLAGAAVLGPALVWRMWWGGQCPPARFLVPMVPVLALALADYPRAWLAIGDDAVTSDASATAIALSTVPVEHMGSDPPLPPEALKSMMQEARAAMDAHDYPKAIAILTKLQRQPEFPDRARAQEMLGLARERSGQLAHAKAEYEEYLRQPQPDHQIEHGPGTALRAAGPGATLCVLPQGPQTIPYLVESR